MTTGDTFRKTIFSVVLVTWCPPHQAVLPGRVPAGIRIFRKIS